MRGPFVPTHILKEDIPELNLTKGIPVRQVNPFADGELSHRMCYTEEDYRRGSRTPWIFVSANLEELPSWHKIKKEMADEIMNRR